MTERQRFSDQIRQALRDAGETRYSISKATGIKQGQLCRFLQGFWLTQQTMDRLAAHLDLVVMPRSSTTAAKSKQK